MARNKGNSSDSSRLDPQQREEIIRKFSRNEAIGAPKNKLGAISRLPIQDGSMVNVEITGYGIDEIDAGIRNRLRTLPDKVIRSLAVS